MPALAGKLDMLPGRTNRLRIMADRPGTFRGQCAEYCGGPHAWMAFHVVAEDQERFDAWARRQREPAQLRGRANGAFRTVVLISNSASPAVLSAIVVVASSAAAFAVAGMLGFAATAIGAVSPLRSYAAREAVDVSEEAST